jgi:hypothetical protein
MRLATSNPIQVDSLDNCCFVWLEDFVTGAKVSAEASETYHTKAASPGIIPIFIPAK